MRNNTVEAYYKKYEKKLNEPIVRNFLKEKAHYNLFQSAIESPTKENIFLLNRTFSEYYRKVKIINYISTLIHFYSIDFDKKMALNKKRNILNFDSSTGNQENTTVKITIGASSQDDSTYIDFEKNMDNLTDHISDERLYTALNYLSRKQLNILKLIYLYDYSNKKVAKTLSISEQTVSYNHKRALQKLRETMKKAEEDKANE
ncbi:sigma-70 family RNA polymerase sigma factor [Bacillus mobilis]|uniref:sigma-70 family RNA polymerase sigma factor n=1 Tax=Bacillus mobilis TaxID=2026190 RepID=UPI002E1B3863|nr:sigma-70 family RNA polymerase sigma factor [Bacillus mobilis]MED0957975.1 sigma-70 family RNA polymerase sigma factor [Bacillus mobilis]